MSVAAKASSSSVATIVITKQRRSTQPIGGTHNKAMMIIFYIFQPRFFFCLCLSNAIGIDFFFFVLFHSFVFQVWTKTCPASTPLLTKWILRPGVRRSGVW